MPFQRIFDPEEDIVIKIIKDVNGNVAAVCKQLGTSRPTFVRYLTAHPVVQQALADTREEMLDMAETSLYRRVLAGDAWAVCLVPDTPILLADNSTKPINAIEVGDAIRTGRGENHVVTAVHERVYTGTLIGLQVAGSPGILAVTPEHPIWSHTIRNGVDWWGWHPAGQLQIDDGVGIAKYDQCWPLEDILYTEYSGKVYNLTVDIDPTYVANGIVVHNCFFLKTQGRKRGYIERAETFNLKLDLNELSIEQLEKLAAGEHPSLVLGAAAGQNPEGTGTTDPLTIEGTSRSSAASEASE